MKRTVALIHASKYALDRMLTLPISIFLLAACGFGVMAQTTQPVQMTTLKAGAVTVRRLDGGAKDSYELRVASSEFVRVIVDQLGIDVVVVLIGEDGEKLIEVDRPNGGTGPEELVWVAPRQQRYRLEVRALEQQAAPGKYAIKLSEIRQSTVKDQKRIAAQQAFVKGMQLNALQQPDLMQGLIDTSSDALRLWIETGDSSSAAYAAELIANAYARVRNNDKAIESYKQAAALHSASGDLYREAIAINNVGLVYGIIHEPNKSLEWFERALALRRRIGDRSGESVTLLNIGSTYWEVREYQKSLNYSFEALEHFKSLGDRYGQARSLYHIGWVYFSTTQNAKAVEYLEQALVLQRELDDQSEMLSTLDTLARASANGGDRKKALDYLQQKLTKLEARGDGKQVAETTTLIGIMYAELIQPQQALPYLQKALRLQRETGDRRELAITLNGLGWVHYMLGEIQQAETYYQESLGHGKALRDADWQAKVLYNLAELKCVLGSWKEAELLLAEALELEESEIASDMLLSEAGQKKFILKGLVRSEQLSITIAAQLAATDESAIRLALTTLLRRKGRILDSEAEEYSALRRNANPETVFLLDQLSQHVSKQAELKLRGPNRLSLRQFESEINALQAKIEEVRVKLNNSSFRFRMQTETVSLAAVQEQLPSDTALVEFTVWVPFDRTRPEINKFGDPRYVAYLLFKQGPPQFIDLGDAAPISRLSLKLHRLQIEPLAEIDSIKLVARELDELLMRPIRQRLNGQKRLLISPEGQLNLVSFASLIDERAEYLAQNYIISYLASGRDLLRLRLPRPAHDPPLIVGNPDFENISGWSSKVAVSAPTSRGGPFLNLTWTSLPGTDFEAREIKNLMPAANLRLGAQATESEVKQTNAPSVLHLATHGFFLAETPREESAFIKLFSFLNISGNNKQVENPLLRSGLVLAGANRKRSGAEDGVLTGMEMAGLNLWGTKLVVLSACQTGIGDLETGDGVYGLRRAIVLAGAEAQVMSLWKVDDKVTAKLMVEYYTNLLRKREGRADALRSVQLRMLKGEHKHPYYWAGFIESGAWTAIAEPK